MSQRAVGRSKEVSLWTQVRLKLMRRRFYETENFTSFPSLDNSIISQSQVRCKTLQDSDGGFAYLSELALSLGDFRLVLVGLLHEPPATSFECLQLLLVPRLHLIQRLSSALQRGAARAEQNIL